MSRRKMMEKPALQRIIDSGDEEAMLNALTPQQADFVHQFLVDYNGTQAAIRAGYSKESATKLAYQLRRNPLVEKCIQIETERRRKHLDVDVGWVLMKMIKTIERCESEEGSNPMAVLRGAELIGKYLNMFSDKLELTGKDGGAIKTQKVEEDADAFSRAITSLASRRGTGEGTEETLQ